MNSKNMNSKSDTLIFLAKVIVSSAALSALIKFGGPLLPVAGLAGAELNRIAIALILTPSLIVATFLLASARRHGH
jgi:hypothetical protein